MDLEGRFWIKVDKHGPRQPHMKTRCWVWTAFTHPESGYGYFGVGIRSVRAHKVSWQIANGAVPAKLCVLHKCDLTSCVRPSHLFVGTQRENVHDMAAKGRHGRARLTIALVREIRSSTLSGRALAAKYKVSPATISRVVTDKLWRHT